jgi:hypothetical protein
MRLKDLTIEELDAALKQHSTDFHTRLRKNSKLEPSPEEIADSKIGLILFQRKMELEKRENAPSFIKWLRAMKEQFLNDFPLVREAFNSKLLTDE